mgnify:CR=1 FL=1
MEILAIASVGLGLGFIISSIGNIFYKLFLNKFIKKETGLTIGFLGFVGALFITKIIIFSIILSIFLGLGFIIPILLFTPQKNE